MPSELIWIVITSVLTVASVVFQPARVLAIPFATVVVLIAIFWAARRAAEREE